MKQRLGLFIVFLFILGCDGELNRSVSIDRDGAFELYPASPNDSGRVDEGVTVPAEVVFEPSEHVNEPAPVESEEDLPAIEPEDGQQIAQEGGESRSGEPSSESEGAGTEGCVNGSDSVDSCGANDEKKEPDDGASGVGEETGDPSSEGGVDEHKPAVEVDAPGLENLYRVSDDLYRSAQPDAEGLVSAKMLGIKTVLSLQLITFDPSLEETAQSGLTLVHVPMVPWSIPTESLVEALLMIKNADKPVLVHCLHGSDRTGTVVALYRILFENWSREDALTEMTSETFGYHEEFDNLPAMIDGLDLEQLYSEVFSAE